MSTQNKALLERFHDRIWNEGDLKLIDELLAPEFVGHMLTGDEPIRGQGGMKEFVALVREAFPDLTQTVDDLIAEGDKVVIRWTARGTHDGDLMGIEPTGRRVTFAGMGIMRFRDGKIVEGWMNPNLLGLFRQLGVAPQAARA